MSFKNLGHKEIVNKAKKFREIINSFNWEEKEEETEYKKFLRNNSIAPIIGVICDERINADQAWEFPYYLSNQIDGEFNSKTVSDHTETKIREDLESYMNGKLPSKMKIKDREEYLDKIPKCIVKSCNHISEKYHGNPDNMFILGKYSTQEIYFILNELNGLGQKKISMVIRDFAKKKWVWYEGLKARGMDLKMTNLEYTTVPIDYHIKTVFQRMTGEYSATDSDIQFFGKLAYPEFPAGIDEIMWIMGRTYCKDRNCSKCYLKDVPCEYHLKNQS